jgi:hypothetical protein
MLHATIATREDHRSSIHTCVIQIEGMSSTPQKDLGTQPPEVPMEELLAEVKVMVDQFQEHQAVKSTLPDTDAPEGQDISSADPNPETGGGVMLH